MKDHLAIINNQEGSKHSTRLVTQAVVLILYKREVLFRFRRTTINRRHQKDLKEDTLSSKDLEGLRGGKKVWTVKRQHQLTQVVWETKKDSISGEKMWERKKKVRGIFFLLSGENVEIRKKLKDYTKDLQSSEECFRGTHQGRPGTPAWAPSRCCCRGKHPRFLSVPCPTLYILRKKPMIVTLLYSFRQRETDPKKIDKKSSNASAR